MSFVILADICHSYQAFNTTYSDTGLFGVYMVCEPLQCDDISKAVLEAWHRVGNSITESELDEAKNRLITQLLNQQNSELSLDMMQTMNIDFDRLIDISFVFFL